MNGLVELYEKPKAEERYLIAGWRQWADAGAISSGLPRYLVELTGARKIGEFKSGGYYLFQIPGTHHLIRPVVKLEEGYRKSLHTPINEIFYAETNGKGLFIFLGDEPHLSVDRYAEAFFEAVEALRIERVAAVGGVYGAMPYDKDRDISCVYSLREMKEELEEYAVRFSNYEGGATIGTYLADRAERKGIEFLVFYGFVPAYDFSQPGIVAQGMRVEQDYRAWYDLMRRLNHMFDLGIALADLERKSHELTAAIGAKIAELEIKMPQLEVREYLTQLEQDFTERTFSPLSDLWEAALGDILKDLDD